MVYSNFASAKTPSNHVNRRGYVQQNVLAFAGRCQVVEEHDPFWGKGKSYKSRILTDPTWGQLFRCAKSAQKKTGDYHHDFFEGAVVAGEVDGVKIIHLIMGS